MNLKEFRNQIADAWLPIVGRQRLSSSEYDQVTKWFKDQIEIDVILKAIQTCSKRARRTGATLYSIGVIKADIQIMAKKKADTQLGAHAASDWRDQWAKDLAILVEEETNPIFQKIYSALLSELPSLTEAQAREKWKKIQAAMRQQVNNEFIS